MFWKFHGTQSLLEIVPAGLLGLSSEMRSVNIPLNSGTDVKKSGHTDACLPYSRNVQSGRGYARKEFPEAYVQITLLPSGTNPFCCPTE